MSVSEVTRLFVTNPASSDAMGADHDVAFLACDECAAPVDESQRYCVYCGAHRGHVRDPAATYLSQASARARVGARMAAASQGARGARRRTVGLGTAVLIALIPTAGLVGVGIGDSGSGTAAPAAHTRATTSGSAGKTSKSSAAAKSGKDATGNSYVNQQNNLPNTVTP